ncbi:MAG: dihydrolipoyl dehydrogenase [Elusimicrobia bacterium]|nr:dihydrolipoyl dehydrogenase [Elusimicrobiota bacterium]
MKTEILVIGAGPGGYVAAIRLARLGKKVLLVDKHKLGGECLNYGCIPSKALLDAAKLFHKVRRAQNMGILADNLTVDLKKLQDWKNRVVGGLGRGIDSLLKANKIDFLAGEAVFAGPRQVQVSGEPADFDQAVIAAGSRPMDIVGFSVDGKFVLGSREALALEYCPKSLLVIGGGAIGLEIATFYAKLGASVTIVEMLSQILPGIETEFVVPVSRSLARLGVNIHVGARVLGYEIKNNLAHVQIKTSEGDMAADAEKVILAAGRRPNSAGLGLESAGIQADSQGFIRVNEKFETTAAGIYAIGDVIRGPMLAHRASAQAKAVAEIIAAMSSFVTSRRQVTNEDLTPSPPEDLTPWPSAVFTDPEIALVCLTETEAKSKNISFMTGKFPFTALGRAAAAGETDGFVKIVAEKNSRKILGAAIVGPHASDLISEACLAVRLGATIDDIAATIHPHPTFPEAFMEVAEAASGQAVHIAPVAPAVKR